jgi:hypothetical protein
MIEINTFFFNYYVKNPSGQPLKKHLNSLGYDIITDKSKEPQIIMSSVYGNLNWIEKYPKTIKILYSNENLYHKQYKKITDKIDSFDYFIGDCNYENCTNWYRIPSFYMYHSIFQKKDKYYEQIINNKFNIENKKKNICLVSKNPQYLRLKIINKLKLKKITVDCPGRVGKNIPDIGMSWDDKINFLSEYHINVCPENSYLADYITEKLLHASLANCIPVYWGCEHLEHGLYNKDKILLINKDKSNLDKIINEIDLLIRDPKKLKERSSLPPFNSEIFIEKINHTDNVLYNLCKELIERLK